jgi:serine/threonine-protein kinase
MAAINGGALAAWTVPGYTETGALGTGGTGRVVGAVHEASGTRVAVKYLSARLCADESFRERFRTEAAPLTELEHPNVVRLRELVETNLDAALVMELVEGSTLHAVLAAAGPLSPEAALAVLRGSLLGLGAAHAVDVVHRDYKPSNVFLTSEGVSKLADCGVATRTEAMMPAAGTPSYMAPEQWEGAPAQPTNDIYAVTATFYECLTGHVPYSAESVFELQTMHRAAPIPVADVPKAVRPLVAQGLAKAPEDRPADVAAFLAELEAAAVLEYGLEWEERGRRELAALVRPPVPAPRTEGAAVAVVAAGGDETGWVDEPSAWDGPRDERGGMSRGTKTGLAAAAVAVIGAVVAAVTLAPGKGAPAASGTSGEIVAAPSDTKSSSDGGAPGAAVGGPATPGSNSSGSTSPTKPSSSASTKPTTATLSPGTPSMTATPISLPLATLSSGGPTATLPPWPTSLPPNTSPTSPATSATPPTSSSTVTISAAASLTNGTYNGVCPPTNPPAVTVVFSVGGLPSGGTIAISYHWHVAGSGPVGNGGGGVGGGQTVTATKDGPTTVRFTVDIPTGRKALSGAVQVTWSAPGLSGGTVDTEAVNITCTN